MKKYFVVWIIAISLISYNGLAQKVYSYTKGVIVKKNGDTLKCYIPMSVYYASNIKYRLDKETADKNLKTEEIKLLQTPYNTFENIFVDNKEYLMRIVTNGKIMLYSYVIPDEGSNPNGGTYLFKAPNINYTIKKENVLFIFNESNYKNLLSEHLSDCPQLTKSIGSKGYKYEDIEKIVDEYNKCDN